MITSLIILYFIIGCIVTYILYQKDKKEFRKYHIEQVHYSENMLTLLAKIICWPIVLLIVVEI